MSQNTKTKKKSKGCAWERKGQCFQYLVQTFGLHITNLLLKMMCPSSIPFFSINFMLNWVQSEVEITFTPIICFISSGLKCNTAHIKVSRWLKGNDIKTNRSRVKSVCFDFRPTNVGSSVIKTDRSVGRLSSIVCNWMVQYAGLYIYIKKKKSMW